MVKRLIVTKVDCPPRPSFVAMVTGRNFEYALQTSGKVSFSTNNWCLYSSPICHTSVNRGKMEIEQVEEAQLNLANHTYARNLNLN